MPIDRRSNPLVATLGEGIDASFEALAQAVKKSVTAGDKDLIAALKKRTKPIATMTLTGFIGDSEDRDWLRLYVDETLNTFVVVRWEDVLGRETRKLDGGPPEGVDVIWVSREARVSHGQREPEIKAEEARFLQGDFMAAGELEGAVATRDGGSSSGGLFCDATTPGCCRPASGKPGYPR